MAEKNGYCLESGELRFALPRNVVITEDADKRKDWFDGFQKKPKEGQNEHCWSWPKSCINKIQI